MTARIVTLLAVLFLLSVPLFGWYVISNKEMGDIGNGFSFLVSGLMLLVLLGILKVSQKKSEKRE